jgi:hypothetical protein
MVHNLKYPVRGSCACRICTFEAMETPKARLVCHCTICQAFTHKAFSDVAVFPAFKARLKNEDRIAFKMYKKHRLPPPNLSRGRCQNCGGPVVETWGTNPRKILFLPAVNFEKSNLLPAPVVHVFYEHRQNDVHDDVPKYEGYLKSQAAIARMIMLAM